MPWTPLERLAKLEQPRVIENGFPVIAMKTEYQSIGVDTLEDLEQVRAIMQQQKGT